MSQELVVIAVDDATKAQEMLMAAGRLGKRISRVLRVWLRESNAGTRQVFAPVLVAFRCVARRHGQATGSSQWFPQLAGM